MKYTKKHIQEYKAYLGYCYKEGYLDDYECEELIKNKKWKEIYDMMAYGDYYCEMMIDIAREEEITP